MILQFIATPAVADISGDGLPEAIQGSGVYDVHAFDINGDEPDGWPKFTNGWMVGSPAVGDIDGDGLLEVVAVTREGNLYAWNTTGDECGPVLWRRYHHDEWGTGNYHTDTRPPASLRTQDVVVTSQTDAGVELQLAAVPGDDLYCGEADLELRFSDTPIESAADFAAAELAVLDAVPAAGRAPGVLAASSEQWRDRAVYLALATVDEAGNRSTVTSIGSLDFQRADSDDGCSVTRPSSHGVGPLLFGLVVVWSAGRRRARRGGAPE